MNDDSQNISLPKDQKSCLNCGYSLSDENHYCPNCGQKVREGKVTLGHLFSDFLFSIFNFDNRFWTSFRLLFIPGLLTNTYISGRRQRLLAPMRLLIFLTIVHFACLKIYMERHLPQGYEQIETVGSMYQMQVYDSMAVCMDMEYETGDSTLDWYSCLVETIGKTPDTVSTFVMFGEELDVRKLITSDIHNLSRDELYEEYQLESFWQKAIMNQGLRFFLEGPRNYVLFLLTNIVWGLLVTILLTALIMKFLYIRRKRYYVEHLLFQVDFHSFTFLLFSIVWLLLRYLGEIDWILVLASGIVLVYLWLAIRRYYAQGFFKTSIKFFLMGMSYLMVLLLVMSVNLLISFLIF